MTLAAHSKADPKAVAVARAVHDALPLDSIILFGSRARGDHRPDSDIDLMLIHGAPMSNDDYRKASKAAHDAIERIYGKRQIAVDLLRMPKSKYKQCRGGINHVAAQAARDGVDMNGEKQEYEPEDTPAYDWHDIQQRVISADRRLGDIRAVITGGGSQEAVGFHAQQALENILKAWISALGAEYRNTHELDELLRIVKTVPDEQNTDAAETLTWLTEYAVEYRYEGATIEMDDPAHLYARIERVVNAVYERIMQLTGVDELPRYAPPGQKPPDE